MHSTPHLAPKAACEAGVPPCTQLGGSVDWAPAQPQASGGTEKVLVTDGSVFT